MLANPGTTSCHVLRKTDRNTRIRDVEMKHVDIQETRVSCRSSCPGNSVVPRCGELAPSSALTWVRPRRALLLRSASLRQAKPIHFLWTMVEPHKALTCNECQSAWIVAAPCSPVHPDTRNRLKNSSNRADSRPPANLGKATVAATQTTLHRGEWDHEYKNPKESKHSRNMACLRP